MIHKRPTTGDQSRPAPPAGPGGTDPKASDADGKPESIGRFVHKAVDEPFVPPSTPAAQGGRRAPDREVFDLYGYIEKYCSLVPPEAEPGDDPPAPPAPFDPGPLFDPEPGDPSLERRWDHLLTFCKRTRGKTSRGIIETLAWRFIWLGYWPILIAPGSKAPVFSGWKSRPPDGGQWAWAARKLPGAGIALRLGEAGGLVDLDVDDLVQAKPSLEQLFPGGVPDTLGWSTGRGYHLLFRYEARLAAYQKSVIRLPGVELKLGHVAGDDRALHAVIPPSRMADGRVRLWNDGRGVWPLPGSVFAYLDGHAGGPVIRHPGGSLRCAPLATEDAQKRGVTAPTPGRIRRRGNGRPDPVTRAILYLNRCPASVQGQDGSGACFAAACFVGPGFDLTRDATVRLLLAHYNPRCDPPWSDPEIEHKVADAYAKESRRGWLLNATRG